MLNLHKIWIEQCEATKGIKDHFGTERAMSYLVPLSGRKENQDEKENHQANSAANRC